MTIVIDSNGNNIDSLAAYESVKPFLSEARYNVLKALYARGPSTYKELASYMEIDLTNVSWSTVTARLSELKEFGYVIPTELKRDKCRVVSITTEGILALGLNV